MKLYNPSIKFKEHYINFMKETKKKNELEVSIYSDLLKLTTQFTAFLSYLEEIKEKPQDNFVLPIQYFWAIQQNKMVGRLSLRKNNGHTLFQYIGNIGYWIAPSERKKGYGNEILALGKKKAKKLQLNEILITCNKTNIASQKIILNNGGQYIDEIY